MFLLKQFIMDLPDACLVDLTSPTFAGITGLVPQQNGSLLASWAAGSDANPPLQYHVFIQPQSESASLLFTPGNLALITKATSIPLFFKGDGSLLVAGVNYRVGVRCADALGNIETNTVAFVALSAGVLEGSLLDLADQLETLITTANSAVNGFAGLPGKVVKPDILKGKLIDVQVLSGEIPED